MNYNQAAPKAVKFEWAEIGFLVLRRSLSYINYNYNLAFLTKLYAYLDFSAQN